MSDILPAPAGLHHVTKMSTANMNYRQTLNHYKQKGYSSMMAEFFADIDLDFQQETKHQTEEQINNKQIIKSQFNRLDKLIKINHVKLNNWFHLDNPNGFGFPDEVWSLIKSYNPAPIKILKELKYSQRNNIPPKKVIMFKKWKFNANGYNIETRRTNIGSWFLYSPASHFVSMHKILNGIGSSWSSCSTKYLLEHNDCTMEELKAWAEKKGYWGDRNYITVPDDRYTNHEKIREDWDKYWFVYVTYKNQNFLNLRFICVKINKADQTFQLMSDNTICKKIKIDEENEIDEIKLTSKNRKKILEGSDSHYFTDWIDLNEFMPIEFVKNVMPNSKVMKAFGKAPKLPQKLYKCWKFD